MEVKTYSAVPIAQPTTLYIHCGDPRFQEAFARFPEEELGLRRGEWVPLIPPGGIASLSEAMLFPKEFKVLKDAVAFYVGHFGSIKTVILVNHEDCGKYKAMHQIIPLFLGSTKNMVERQRGDLQKVAQIIAAFLGRPVEIKQYFAKFANSENTEVTFEAVNASK